MTERGVPVARLGGVEATSLLERLEADGLLEPPPKPARSRVCRRRRPRRTRCRACSVA
nr:hypothetical protein [Demequina litorisediminis]